MFIVRDEVFHVGSLEPSSRTTRSSLEGPCLSVSIHPEEWGHIARVGGPAWTLACDGAQWFSPIDMTDDQVAEMMAWGVAEGLVEGIEVFRAWHFDGESDDWRYFTFGNREDAEREIDEDDLDDPPEDVPSGNGEMVDATPGWRLTSAAMELLERWDSVLDGQGGIEILYAMLHLAPQNPDLVGIWWDEIEDPASLSCPRGGIFPDRMDMFEIHDDRGNLPPIRQNSTSSPSPM